MSGFGQGSCLMPPAGLTNWWPGQNNTKDVVGGLDGVLSNGTSFASGVVGQAFSFNGVNQFVTNPVPVLTNILNSYTMEFWARPAATRQTTSESTSGTSGTAGQRYAIFPNNGRFAAAGAGVSVGTNGISVFEHASLYLPSVLVYDVAITNWVHVGVVYSNQQPSLYLNGSLVRIGLASTHASSPSTCLGENGLNYGYYAGLLDEVSIYDRALSATEVLSIYNAGSAGKCGPPTPPDIFLQPTNQSASVGGTAIFSVGVTGTLPLTYQWLFEGTNNIAITTDPSLVLTNVQPGQAGNYQVVVTNIAGAATSSVAVLTVSLCTPGAPGLVAWYAAEGNTYDSAGTNHGMASNSVAYAAGVVGQGFHFNGGSYVRIPSNPSLILSNAFTVELWYKAEANGVNGGLIARRNSESNPLNFGISTVPSVQIDAYFNDPGVTGNTDAGGSVFEISRYTPAPPVGAFHHLAVVYEQVAVNLVETRTYLDGQLVRSRSFPGELGRAANSAPITIGASIEYPGYEYFQGVIDEVGLYNRALSSSEILALFNSASHGQCIPPIIYTQPTNQTVVTGNSAAFAVVATGSLPLAYRWSFNGTNLAGATTSALVLGNVQTNQAGNYAVQISNSIGLTNSAVASLTVLPPPPCLTTPPNLVSWWRAEGNGADEVSGNHGALSNGVGFAQGRTGQGFVFNGSGSVGQIGNPPNLQLQNLTIETWLRRSSSTTTSLNSNSVGYVFGYDNGGYALYLAPDGTPTFGKTGSGSVAAGVTIPDTNLHHVAVTKSGSAVGFYLDGVAYPAPAYNPGFTFGGTAFIGGLGTNFTLLGGVDELAVYSRALSAAEIQGLYNAALSGKCPASNYPPFLVTQPANQTVLVGANATFSATAAGTPPLGYQWWFKNSPLAGATNASLTVSNVQVAHAGNYSVAVTSPAGAISSSNATLNINFPTAAVRVVNTNATAGTQVLVPVSFAANGNENALAFSVNFDSNRLAFVGAILGNVAPGAILQPNTSQTNLGRIGISVIMPFGTTFTPGTQTVAQLVFNAALFTNTTVISQLTFGDQPLARQLLDTQPALLAVSFSNGTLTISPATAFEGDAFPRPGGDRTNSLIDWLYVGRYAARLDAPTNATEFQRADSAPRSTFGDGTIKASDWVQAGRYAFGLDPQTPVGGPTNEIPGPAPAPSASRIITATGATLFPAESTAVSLNLSAQGNENALSFSVSFDPGLVEFTGATLGNGATGAILYLNTNQLAAGRVGFVVGLGAGGTFGTGNRELLRLGFQASAFNSGSFAPSFSDSPVPREVADVFGWGLPVGFSAGELLVYPPPSLRIARAGDDVLVGWPQWASNFILQEATNESLAALGWTNLGLVPAVSNGENIVVVPATNSLRFYRLIRP